MGLPAPGGPGLGAYGYNAEGFSRERVFISMNRNEESSLPGITSMPSISRHARQNPKALLRIRITDLESEAATRDKATPAVARDSTRQSESDSNLTQPGRVRPDGRVHKLVSCDGRAYRDLSARSRIGPEPSADRRLHYINHDFSETLCRKIRK